MFNSFFKVQFLPRFSSKLNLGKRNHLRKLLNRKKDRKHYKISLGSLPIFLIDNDKELGHIQFFLGFIIVSLHFWAFIFTPILRNLPPGHQFFHVWLLTAIPYNIYHF